jgi:hypothetical protein
MAPVILCALVFGVMMHIPARDPVDPATVSCEGIIPEPFGNCECLECETAAAPSGGVGQEVDEAELEARRAQLQARKAQDALDRQSAAADPATVSCEGIIPEPLERACLEDQTLREEDYYYYYSIENRITRGAQTPDSPSLTGGHT